MSRKSLVGVTREQWLADRRLGIGGSDAPALVLPPDAYKWHRPRDVYANKVLGTESEDSLPMRFGRFAEEFVAEEFTAQTGLRVQRYGYTLTSDAHPFMRATIDRKVVGARIGVECKTTSAYNDRRFGDDNYPYEYYVQCQHYLAVTGWDAWYLAALVGNRVFRVYRVERNEDDIREIIDAESRFWNIITTHNEKELEQWA